jgi:hypothetical protein
VEVECGEVGHARQEFEGETVGQSGVTQAEGPQGFRRGNGGEEFLVAEAVDGCELALESAGPGHSAICCRTPEPALALLTQRWREHALNPGQLAPWLAEVQQLEDALWSVLILRFATATDDQLAQFGVLLGVADPGGGQFLALIRAAALAIRSSGTGDELRAVLYAVKQQVGAYLITEYFPAALVIEPVVAIAPPAAMVHAIARRAVAAGVRLLTVEVPTGDTFAFSDTDETVTDAGRGFSDTAGLVGGQLVGVIE